MDLPLAALQRKAALAMPKERPHWFPCYPLKWLNALAGMTPLEGYVYFIICLRVYEHWGPIPDSLTSLAKRLSMRPSRVDKIIKSLLAEGKLERTKDGFLTNPFADEVITEQTTKADSNRKVKSAAAFRTWEKRKRNQSKPHTDGIQTDEESESDIEREGVKPLLESQNPNTIAAQAAPLSLLVNGGFHEREDADASDDPRSRQVSTSPDDFSPLNQSDIESKDRLVLVRAADWQSWQRDMPDINVRNHIKSALHYYETLDPWDRVRRLRSWCQSKQDAARERADRAEEKERSEGQKPARNERRGIRP